MHLSGLIYKEFDYKKHVIAPFEVPDDWPVYMAIDPHPRTAHAVLFMAVSRDGVKYIFDEIFRACIIDELAQLILVKLGKRKPKTVLIDPSAIVPDPVTGLLEWQRLGKYGLYPVPASKCLSEGILRVKRALIPVVDGAKPEIMVFSNCQRTIFEFNNYMWDEWRGGNRQNHEPKNKPLDKDDHMMENLYRLLLSNPRYEHRSYRGYENYRFLNEYKARNPVTGF